MAMMELKGFKGLQGLDTLLAESKSVALATKERIVHLSLDSLSPGKYQPRTHLDEDALNELAVSIKAQGILLPLIVRGVQLDHYEIIAGERRWRAAQLAGFNTVPVIIREVSDETALAFALIENIQRESLNPIDEALAFARLKADFAMTHEEIAMRVGRSRAAVTNLVRLLGLQEEVKTLLRTKKLEMGHARALLSLAEGQQVTVANFVVAKSLSVRETEKLVQRTHTKPRKQQVLSAHLAESDFLKRGETFKAHLAKLAKTHQLKIKLQVNQQGKGKVVINFASQDEADWIMDHLNFEKR